MLRQLRRQRTQPLKPLRYAYTSRKLAIAGKISCSLVVDHTRILYSEWSFTVMGEVSFFEQPGRQTRSETEWIVTNTVAQIRVSDEYPYALNMIGLDVFSDK